MAADQLFHASWKGDLETCRGLLEKMNPSDKNNALKKPHGVNCTSPLMAATQADVPQQQVLELCTVLLDSKADVNQRDNDGLTYARACALRYVSRSLACFSEFLQRPASCALEGGLQKAAEFRQLPAGSENGR